MKYKISFEYSTEEWINNKIPLFKTLDIEADNEEEAMKQFRDKTDHFYCLNIVEIKEG